MKKWVNKDNTTTVAPTFSFFPMSSWLEWDKDCKEHFGNQRWVKAYNDHRLAQMVALMQGQIDELKAAVHALSQVEKEPEKEEPKGVKTLGGFIAE